MRIKRSLVALLVVYMLGTLCLQGFNLVYAQIGDSLGVSSTSAALITALPGVALGIVCFIYGSLGDFISLRKLALFGIGLLIAGSLLGFFIHNNIVEVILFRIVQTAGYQACGSVFVVMVSRYLDVKSKFIYMGVYTAGFQVASAIGVLCAGILSTLNWAFVFLIPVISVVCIPFIARNIPEKTAHQSRIDALGFALFSVAITMLTLFISQKIVWMGIIALIFLVAFGFYIHTARNPFITVQFLADKRWLKSVSLILVFFCTNFTITALFNAVGTTVYGLSTSFVSMMLLPAFVIAAILATSSGAIINRFGTTLAMLIAGTLMVLGMLSSWVLLNQSNGILMIVIGSSLMLGGTGLVFSPTYNMTLATKSVEESGRACGMNDLAMQGGAAIGSAIFGGIIATPGTNYAVIFGIYALIAACGIALFLVFQRDILGLTR